MGIIDTIKERPLLAGGVALAAIVVVLFFVGSGSSEAETGPTGMSSVEAGNAILQANQQAATEAAGIAAQLRAVEISASSALQAKEIEAHTTQAANILAADVESKRIAAQLQSETTQSTLLTQLETNKYLAQRDVALANTNAALETERLRSAENIATQNILRDVFLANVQSQERMYTQQLQTAALIEARRLEEEHIWKEQAVITQRFAISQR